jgi:hypothetical protein
LPPSRQGRGLRLDLRPAVRLDLWAVTLAIGVVLGTVAPSLIPEELEDAFQRSGVTHVPVSSWMKNSPNIPAAVRMRSSSAVTRRRRIS